MKFKVGDKIVGNKKANNAYNTTREGWRGTVTGVLDDGRIEAEGVGLFGLRARYKLEPKCFDLVASGGAVKNKVVITTDGKTTLARLYEGSRVVKSATAECSPDDEFKFVIGATVAFNRLFDKPAADKPDKPKKPYNGKVICVNPKHYSFYTKGKIYECVNGKFYDDDGASFSMHTLYSFEELQKSSHAEWLEVVE